MPNIWICSKRQYVYFNLIVIIIIFIYHTRTEHKIQKLNSVHTHTHTQPFTFVWDPRWAGTRKVKPMWILLEQETVSGSGISWAICKSARRSRQITTPAPHHSIFTGRMSFLPPNQQPKALKAMYIIMCTVYTKVWKATREATSRWTGRLC